MTTNPTTPLLPHLALNPAKTTAAGSCKTPSRTPAAWTWTHILRVVSPYYLATVIGLAGNVDLGTLGRATGVIVVGNVIRMVATAVSNELWPTRCKLVLLEFAVVTLVSTLHIFNTVDLC